jgi:hypothetical protein
MKKKERVNHPAHYNAGSIEVIDALEAWGLGFSTGNAVKYIARAKHKGFELEDLKKARWYLDREIGNAEKAIKAANRRAVRAGREQARAYRAKYSNKKATK